MPGRTCQVNSSDLKGSSSVYAERELDSGIFAFQDLFGYFSSKSMLPILLETCTPDGDTILAWNPVAIVSVERGLVHVRAEKGIQLPSTKLHPYQVTVFLQRIVDKFKVTGDGVSDKRKFVGGFVGYVGYEWMAGQEIPARSTVEGVPDMWFGLYDRAVVKDYSGKTRLVVASNIKGTSIGDALGELSACASGLDSKSGISDNRARPSLQYDFPKEAYESGVREVKKAIRTGDVYQVNIAQRIRSRRIDPVSLYSKLAKLNPSPFSGMIDAEGFTIVSASPERLVRVWSEPGEKRYVTTRPIAGTRPRASGSQDQRNERALRRSPKERAEHTMLVDLSRNDVGRVSVPGSVEVSELYTVERYSHVMHLVSEVKGRLSSTIGVPQLFRALFPGGSITGTPKIRATEIITSIEPVPRGAFTGSMGYISLNGNMDFNIMIRSAFYPRGSGEMHIYAGSGIVHDSNPSREWEETMSKAAVLVETLFDSRRTGMAWAPPKISRSWKQDEFVPKHADARVLVIDNYDSFTYNLVQYISSLGAGVMVYRNDQATIPELKRTLPSHVLISPGPGRPGESGISLDAVRAFNAVPLLGVCLGHQAIVESYGGTLEMNRLPVHGKSSSIIREQIGHGKDLFNGIPQVFKAGRYHSIIARTVPPEIEVTAWTTKGEIMAVRHKEHPTFGIQFHPESILTQYGMRIISNFLSIKRSGGGNRNSK